MLVAFAKMKKIIVFALLLCVAVNGHGLLLLNRGFGLGAAIPASGGGALTPGLLWLKCNEGSGSTVSNSAASGSGCTNFNGTWTTVAGGSSLTFNGTSQSCSTTSGLTWSSNQIITLTFWINSANYSTGTPQTLLELSSDYSGAPNRFEVINEVDGGGGLVVAFQDNIGNVIIGHFARPSAGGWHNVAIVMNNSVGSIASYIDGSTSAFTIDFSNWSSAGVWDFQFLFIGARGNSSRWFPGGLDDIRIYGGTLSGAQIGAIFTAGQQ